MHFSLNQIFFIPLILFYSIVDANEENDEDHFDFGLDFLLNDKVFKHYIERVEKEKKYGIDEEGNRFDQHHPPPITQTNLVQETFEINCCRGGVPQSTRPELTTNFTFHASDYVNDVLSSVLRIGIDNANSDLVNSNALNCRIFNGSYYIPQNVLHNSGFSYSIKITCKCPDIGSGYQLDDHCRQLLRCKNGGIESPKNSTRCYCRNPFFGDRCEKICYNGKRLPGEECNELKCHNGGREENGRCICLPHFFGHYCEIDTRIHTDFAERNDFGLQSASPPFNMNSGGSRFQRFGDQVSNEMFTRDISGTIFSLIMIIVLVVSMYLLMKHRMQSRYLSRRPDLLGACNFPSGIVPTGTITTTARRVELMPTLYDERQARTFPFRSFVGSLTNHVLPSDDGPPPYLPPGHRGRRNRDDLLPPLPSYEDATKLPPLRQNCGDDANNGSIESTNRQANANDNSIEMVSGTRNQFELRDEAGNNIVNSGTPSSSSSLPSSSTSTPERHRCLRRRSPDPNDDNNESIQLQRIEHSIENVNTTSDDNYSRETGIRENTKDCFPETVPSSMETKMEENAESSMEQETIRKEEHNNDSEQPIINRNNNNDNRRHTTMQSQQLSIQNANDSNEFHF